MQLAHVRSSSVTPSLKPSRRVRMLLRTTTLSASVAGALSGAPAARAQHAAPMGGASPNVSQASPAKASRTAKPTPPAKPVQTDAATSSEQVTVTADRRSQSAQSLGSSISVLSGKTLAARNVNNVFDLQYQVPSLQVTPQFGSGQYEFSIRGVGFEDYASNNAPTVGLYVDEVAFPVPFETNGEIFDVQRVEVLRGPQGTLYGRNTTGGAINYVLNKPTTQTTGGLGVQYGDYNSAKVDGFLSGSLGPDVQVRIAGEAQEGGAWQNATNGDKLGDADRKSLRTLVDWEPTDTLKLELNVHGAVDRSDNYGTHLYAPNSALALLGEGPVTTGSSDRDTTTFGTSKAFASLIGIDAGSKPFEHIDTGGLNLRADEQLSVGTITNLFSYDYADRFEYDDFDASPLALADVAFRTRANTYADELRFTSPSNQRLTYVAGLYYARQFLADGYFGGFDQIYGVDTAVRYSQTVDTYSAFGQATYKLATRWSVIGGFRIEHEDRTLNDFSSYVLSGGVVTNPNAVVNQQSTEYTKPSGKFEVEYHPLDNDMVYAEVSRGVKSGGFTTYNSGTAPAVGTAPFKPETIWAYELGNKLNLPDEHLQFDASGFYYQYENQQIQSAVVNPTTGLVGSIINAPKSHLFGGEAEIRWTPLPHLHLTQSVSESIGRFDEFSSVLSAVRQGGIFVGVYANRAGEALPSPKFTANGSVAYDFDLGRYALTLEGDYSTRTTYYSLFGPLYNVAGYTLLNAHATFGPKNGRWSITALGQNILNKGYDVDRNYFDAGDDIATAGLPATWAVRATVNF